MRWRPRQPAIWWTPSTLAAVPPAIWEQTACATCWGALKSSIRWISTRRLPWRPAPAPSRSRISSGPPALSAPDPPVLFFSSTQAHAPSIRRVCPLSGIFIQIVFYQDPIIYFAYPFSPWNTTIFSALFPFSSFQIRISVPSVRSSSETIFLVRYGRSLVSAVIM